MLSDEPTERTRLTDALDAKPAAFFATHVKSLCIPFSVELKDAARALSLCSGATRLAFWPDDSKEWSLSSLIAQLPLQRLSIEIMHFLHLLADKSCPWFTHITHLELIFFSVEDVEPQSLEQKLALLPHLTHICLNVGYLYNESEYLCVVNSIVVGCPSLQLLLISSKGREVELSHVMKEVETYSRVAIVALPTPDALVEWSSHGHSLWKMAEEAAATPRQFKSTHGTVCA